MNDMHDINDQDKLMAAICWVIPLVAVIVLLLEDNKNRPFQKYHAVNSIGFAVVFGVVFTVLSIIIPIITFGIGTPLICCFFLVWFITFYWAFQAYQGQWVEIPALTDFLKGQGWI